MTDHLTAVNRPFMCINMLPATAGEAINQSPPSASDQRGVNTTAQLNAVHRPIFHIFHFILCLQTQGMSQRMAKNLNTLKVRGSFCLEIYYWRHKINTRIWQYWSWCCQTFSQWGQGEESTLGISGNTDEQQCGNIFTPLSAWELLCGQKGIKL